MSERSNLRLIVCGGRDYADRDRVFETLDRIHARRGIAIVIQGEATGADALAKAWAEARGIRVGKFPANWYPNGDGVLDRGAGPKRNAEMLKLSHPDGVVAFPGKRGTEDMVRQARQAGVTVMVIP